jgi:hypothetical protein
MECLRVVREMTPDAIEALIKIRAQEPTKPKS